MESAYNDEAERYNDEANGTMVSKQDKHHIK